MRTRFDRWLAKPSTLHFLRQLIGEQYPIGGQPRLSAAVQRRRHASGYVSLLSADGGEKRNQGSAPIRRVKVSKPPSPGEDTPAEFAHNLMRHNADVNNDKLFGRLPIDTLGHTDDAIEAWVDILELRQRLSGEAGVHDVWVGMRKRHFDLPVEGEHATKLWESFIHIAAGTGNLPEIISYARSLKERKGAEYTHFYRSVVGHLLAVDPPGAVIWHDRLSEAGFVPTDAMRQIVSRAIQPNDCSRILQRFTKFRNMYERSSERDLYDHAIDVVLAHDMNEAWALKFHRLFITNGDAPSDSVFARPGVQRLFDLDKNESLPMRTIKRVGLSPVEKEKRISVYPALTRANMSSLVGEVHGISPIGISDNIVAKMFATRAFSIESIITGLGFLGIDVLGPLAVRELATRTGTPAGFRHAIDALKKTNVELSNATFSQTVLRMARQDDQRGFMYMIHSDQHHEAYDDAALQEDILKCQLDRNDIDDVRVTLTVLSLLGTEPNARGWNRVLQHSIMTRDTRTMIHTMEQVQSSNTPLTLTTCIYLCRFVLPLRQRGRRPDRNLPHQAQHRFNPYNFVIKAFLYAQDHGLEMRLPGTWDHIITTQGIRDQWRSVESIILKLAEKNLRAYKDSSFGPLTAQGRWVRSYLSDPRMQGQIVVWGFRQGATGNVPLPTTAATMPASKRFVTPEPWARGLALVMKLDKVYGVPIPNIDRIRHSFRHRMMIIFGPGSSKSRLNNESRRKNQYSLAHYIRHANDVWSGFIPDISPRLLEDDAPENHPRLLREFFGPFWRVSEKREQYLDVDAWTKHLLRTAQYIAEPVACSEPMPFTFFRDHALSPKILQRRQDYQQILRMARNPGAYGRHVRARRLQRVAAARAPAGVAERLSEHRPVSNGNG